MGLDETISETSSSGSDSSSDTGSEIDDDDQEHERSEAPPTKGPTMPTKADLKRAAQIRTNAYCGDSDSNDDEMGPALQQYVEKSNDNISAGNLPLGVDCVKPADNHKAEAVGQSSKGNSDSKKLQREEWMLTPGERLPFGGSSSSEPKMPSNRKFERGKLAKKSAEAIAEQREKEYEEYLESEEGKEAQAVLEEYRKKRGPSLMQQHQDSISAKRAKTGSTAFSELRLRGFNRERDMASHRQKGSADVQKMIEEAKELDSKFNKTFAKK